MQRQADSDSTLVTQTWTWTLGTRTCAFRHRLKTYTLNGLRCSIQTPPHQSSVVILSTFPLQPHQNSTFRQGEAEPSPRLPVSLTRIFTRNVKNSPGLILAHAEGGRWAYSFICSGLHSSLHFHITFVRASATSTPPYVTQHTVHLRQEVVMKRLPGHEHRRQAGGWHTDRESWQRDGRISTCRMAGRQRS